MVAIAIPALLLTVARSVAKPIEEAATQLRIERERLQSVLDASPSGVAITSGATLRWANKRAYELSALRVGDDVRSWYAHEEDRDAIVAELREHGKILARELQVFALAATCSTC